MKKKLFTTLATCVALTMSASILPACTNNGTNDDQSKSSAPVQVTETEWNKTISDFKKFGDLKNYTLESTSTITMGEITQSATMVEQVDVQNGIMYLPEIKDMEIGENYYVLKYLEIGNGFEIQEYDNPWKDDPELQTYTVCNYKEIDYSNNGYRVLNINNLDYDNAQLIFRFFSGILFLQDIKYDGEIIALEDAYNKFSYNEESKAYTATAEMPITLRLHNWPSQSIINSGYKHFELETIYSECDVEIIFNENYFNITISVKDETNLSEMSIRLYNFNTTEIELDKEIKDLLKQ